jgi:hypothetical protein
MTRPTWALLLLAPTLFSQPRKPFQSQSPSSISFTVKNTEETVEITNVDFEVINSGIPGRPPNERLVLRKSTHSKYGVDDIGMDASTTVDAWPLGVDLKQKPLYSLTVAGIDPRVVNTDFLVVARGLEETEWWTVYKLGSGQRLFDTYVPLLQFSIARDTVTQRYAGLEVPEDDVADARLKAPNVVAVIIYASADRIIRELLVTCDDPKRAQLLRSFADSTRTMTFSPNNLRLSISQNYPSPPATVNVIVPIAKDDLDTARAQLPAGLHVTAWKR